MSARGFAAWSAACLAIALSSSNPVYRALVLLAALNVLLASRRSDARLLPLFTGMGVASVIATVVTLAVSHTGVHVMFALPSAVPVIGGNITLEALMFGATTSLGIAAAVVAVAPLSASVQPHDLVGALPRALARTGAALGTALNLVPAMARSAGEIRDAQRMRGWRAGRIAEWPDVAVPVVLTALEHSMQLAEAMEARGFASGVRSRYAPEPGRFSGTVLAAPSVVAAIVFIVLRVSGAAGDWYPFPQLTTPAVDPLAVACCVALLAPLVVRHA